jgi:uncharacterized protein YjdB
VLTGRVVAWTSTDAAVATVGANGTVTGVAAGAAQVKATVDGISAGATVRCARRGAASARRGRIGKDRA